MSLSRAEQINKLLKDKRNILITFRKDVTGDAIASAVALSLFLQKTGRSAEIVVDNFSLPRKFQFLEGAEDIKSKPTELQNFIINVDIEEKGLKNISYEIQNGKLRIFVSPEDGMIEDEDIKSVENEFKYDLIFTVDTPNLESLGGLYEKNTELFFNVPIVNIDHDNNNSHFGHINFVDITSTSTVEMIFHLLQDLGKEYIEEEVATALLTGLISKTQSFKGENVTPATLEIAGKLMNLGADRDYIVDNLYRTRTIEELKLWGQALAYLQKDKDTGLVWTTLTRDDFTRCGASEKDLDEIIEELINNSSEAELILILYEHPEAQNNKIHGVLSANKMYNAKQILKPFNPSGNRDYAYITKEKGLKKVEEEITSHIKQTLEEKILN